MDTLELIRALPKAEQHIHIVGATRPETLLWLMKESGRDAPFENLEEVERFFQYSDFDHFISVYSTVSKFIVDEGQFERITYEMLEDDARCNVRYVEASFSAPDHVKQELDYDLIARRYQQRCPEGQGGLRDRVQPQDRPRPQLRPRIRHGGPGLDRGKGG